MRSDQALELEKIMTDWADGIETRNYGINNEIDVHMLSELMRIIVSLAMVAGVLLFYSWIRSQIVNTGYESQNLFAAEQSLLRTQKRLMLEEEILRNPERIDTIARNDLGMTPLRPGQLILPQIQDVERSTNNEMAMADSKAANIKRSVAIKHLGDYSN
jgi:cell division protein FtsL